MADPYSAWQRGANENVNGFIRQYFPKGSDFAHVRRRDAKRVERLLNDRPRRRFDYRIAPPFVSRFSHSDTVTFKAKSKRPAPASLADAVNIFPALGTLQCGGSRCRLKTGLQVVNDLVVEEQVFTGPEFLLVGKNEAGLAEVALIIWSTKPRGKAAIGELSFRNKPKHEWFRPAVAMAAKSLFCGAAGIALGGIEAVDKDAVHL